MAEPFDPSLYVRAPIINIANGVTLANTLVAACPDQPPDNVYKAKMRLKGAAEAAQAALTARRREGAGMSEEDGRILDQEADGSFGALRMRLVAYSMLPVERYPKAERAGELVAEVFGSEGLEFLTFGHHTQNTTMVAVMQHIEQANLKAEIDDIAGPEFLEQIENVLPRYDAMVQDKLRREAATQTNLGDHVRALQAAIVDYANKVCGMVDPDEPASLEGVRRALRPIDAHRETVGRRAAGGGGGSGGQAEGDQGGTPT
ncbi:MAG TPA: hypothetical protein VLS89_13525 [Candidatus Nanopelagicales bacterium]|nr:hypothetical protein [Candidatus Nanopelagicales bacterium]